jgi:uncharacterized membrane protein YhaH (DUF805 family)
VFRDGYWVTPSWRESSVPRKTLLVVIWVELLQGLVRAPFTARPTGHVGWPLLVVVLLFGFCVIFALAVWFTRTNAIGAVWIWLVLFVVSVPGVVGTIRQDTVAVYAPTVVAFALQCVGAAAAMLLIRNATTDRRDEVTTTITGSEESQVEKRP